MIRSRGDQALFGMSTTEMKFKLDVPKNQVRWPMCSIRSP